MATLAKLKTVNASKWIRGVVPVPVGFAGPIHLKDSRGTALPTQFQTVKYGTRGEARTIEIGALYNGTGPQTFTVEQGAGPSAPLFIGPGINRIYARDHTGKDFSANPVATGTMYRDGSVVKTTKRFGYMKNGTETFLGYKFWTTLIAGEDLLIVEGKIHNALIEAQIKGDVFFENLGIQISAGYVVTHFWPELDANGSGVLIKSHMGYSDVMLQKQRREFRFVIHRPENEARARELLAFQGFAVSDGFENPETPWYFPQPARMPNLNHIPLNQWDSWPYSNTANGIYNQIANGSPIPNSQGGNQGRAGPYHPYGVTNGGMTGGDGIWLTDGLQILATGRIDKLAEVVMLHRMVTDRQHVGIYDINGEVVRCETQPSFRTTTIPGTMWGGKEGSYAWKYASTSRYDQVNAVGKLPPYYWYLKGWEAIDEAHEVRRTSMSMILAELLNDPIAKDELEVMAEWARMVAYENTADSSMGEGVATAQNYPGKGAFGGRDSGWIRNAIGEWQQLSPDRSRLRNWFAVDKLMLKASQLPSGSWMALQYGQGKPAENFPGEAVSQSFENGICASGIMACYGATGDPEYLQLLLKAAKGQATYHWKYGTGAPETQKAVRKQDITQPAYTTPPVAPIPLTTDNYQTAAALCWGLMASPNDADIMKAINDMLGADPLGRMMQEGLTKIDNRAVLLGYFQKGTTPPPPIIIDPVPPIPPSRPPTDPTRPTRPSFSDRFRAAMARLGWRI